jgi:3-oxoacyl-[acyl-carrier-protein] synthase III
MHVGIRGVTSYFPEERLDVRYLLESGRLNEDVFGRIGVESVAIAAPDETPMSMGLKAARELLEREEIDPASIDLVVYVFSTTPDYLIWAPSSKLIHELEIPNALGFEMHLGCAGVHAAFQALKGMMLSSTQWNRALVVAADIWGPFVENRTSAGLIFGDSAGAAILDKGEDVPNRLVGYTGFTVGRFNQLVHLPSMTPFSKNLPEKFPNLRNDLFQMVDTSNVGELNKLNPENYRKVADTVMEQSGWNYEDLSFLMVPSGRYDLMRRLAKDFGFEHDRTNTPFLKHQGDLGSPMPLVDLNNVLNKVGLTSGEKMLIVAAGGGITWLGVTIEA